MNRMQALAALIDRVGANEKPTIFGWDEVAQWEGGVLEHFVALGLLAKGVKAQSLECMGCEHNCFMDVLLAGDGERAFIVCDHSELQSQMGRINVPVERLQQWHSSARQFAAVISRLLKLDATPAHQKGPASYKLGMLKGEKGRRWVIMSMWPLVLKVNGHVLPVGDLLHFDGGELAIDTLRIEFVMGLPTVNTEKTYTPDTTKREARRLATKAMYQDWNDEYLALVKKHPKKTDIWFSIQISKLDTALGKSSETIRKNMKK